MDKESETIYSELQETLKKYAGKPRDRVLQNEEEFQWVQREFLTYIKEVT